MEKNKSEGEEAKNQLEEVIERMRPLVDPQADPGSQRLLVLNPCPWNVCSAHCSHRRSCFKDAALREQCITIRVLRPTCEPTQHMGRECQLGNDAPGHANGNCFLPSGTHKSIPPLANPPPAPHSPDTSAAVRQGPLFLCQSIIHSACISEHRLHAGHQAGSWGN